MISHNNLYMRFEITNGIPYSCNSLCLIVGNVNAKRLLELHNEFYCIKRIGTEVICKRSLHSYFRIFNSQLLNDNPSNF